MLVGRQPIRYNRNVNKLYIDMDWRKIAPGAIILVRVYQIVDPEENPDVWNDRWLQQYSTALFAEQWGRNLIKFPNVALPGGVTVNADVILSNAIEMRDKLETELKESYSNPPMDFLA
jgi:hypothetical protein